MIGAASAEARNAMAAATSSGSPMRPSACIATDAWSAASLAQMRSVIGVRTSPGATILHNLICSRAVPEVVREHGGVPVRTKVGHSFIKQQMLETGAIFGGEHSAHYYFLRNFRADSGLIASMLMLDEVSRSGTDLSVLRKPFERYSSSGEINTHVDDTTAVIERVAEVFASHAQDRLDGLTVDCGPWWFNLRPSNTEPLLRLNVEAADEATMIQIRDEVLARVRA